jgi:O-antigen/teichoic acid export membrane protein
MKSSFVSKAVSSIFGSGILTAVNLLIVILLARFMGPHDVGRYQLIISSAMIIGTIGTLGFHGSVVYFVCNKKYDLSKVFENLIFVTIILSIIFFFISLYIFSFDEYFGPLNGNEILLASLSVPILLFFSSLSQLFVANKKIFKYHILQSAPRMLFLFGIFCFLAFSAVTFYNILFLFVVSSFCGVFILIYMSITYINIKFKLDFSLLFEMFKFGSLTTLSYLIILLNSEAMNIFIGVFFPGDFVQIGFFSRAFKTASLLVVLSSALVPLLFSQLSSVNMIERVEQLQKIQRVWCSISLMLVVLLWIFAETIIVILFSADFLPSVKIFRVLVFGTFMYSFITFFNIFHNASGKPFFTTIVMTYNLFVLILFSYFIVPIFGSVGLAYSYVISMFTTLCLSYYMFFKIYKINSLLIFMTKNDFIYIYKKISLILNKK